MVRATLTNSGKIRCTMTGNDTHRSSYTHHVVQQRTLRLLRKNNPRFLTIILTLVPNFAFPYFLNIFIPIFNYIDEYIFLK